MTVKLLSVCGISNRILLQIFGFIDKKIGISDGYQPVCYLLNPLFMIWPLQNKLFFNSQIAFENRAKTFHLTIHVTTFLCLHKLHE